MRIVKLATILMKTMGRLKCVPFILITAYSQLLCLLVSQSVSQADVYSRITVEMLMCKVDQH